MNATANYVRARLSGGIAAALLLGTLIALMAAACSAMGEEVPATTEVSGVAPPATPTSPPGTAARPDSAANAQAAKEPAPESKTAPDTAHVAPPASGGGGQTDAPPAVTPSEAKSPEVKSADSRPSGATSKAAKSKDTRSPAANSKRARRPSPKRGAPSSTAKQAPAKSAGAERSLGRSDSRPDSRQASRSGPAGPVPAADGSEGERVAREIERTTLSMGRASAIVSRSRNGRANDLLGSADQFQQDARSAYDLRQFARAQRLTLAARDYADRATRIVGPATDDPDYVKSVLERTDDALDRLKDVIRSLDRPRDTSRYESLKDDQRDAWKLFHGGDVRGGFTATVRVRDGVLDVFQRLPEVPISCGAADKAIKNAQGTREKAAAEIGARPPAEATRRLAQADGQLAKARAYLARGDCKEALLRAKAAEQQFERSVDAARPSR